VLGLGAFGAVWMSLGSRELQGQHEGEYYTILLACTLGMFTMAEATNLLMAYLALEFVSQTSYVLAGFIKGSRRAGRSRAEVSDLRRRGLGCHGVRNEPHLRAHRHARLRS
jgi:NADH-quinone oxidoreductase subunit N